jgi:hypothetical protein
MADTATINGHRFGWSSVSLGIDGVDQEDFTEINHKWSTERGKVRGKGSRVKAFTEGEHDVEGDISVLKSAWPKILKALKDKYGSIKKASFTITIQTSDTGESEIVTEELIGCRIAGGEDAIKQGTDPLSVKVPLHILRYKINGIDPQE